MPCPRTDDLLDYPELSPADRGPLEAHLATCAECRSLAGDLMAADEALTAHFAHARPDPARILTMPRRVPLLPEVLDCLGWVAVLAVAAGLAAQFHLLAFLRQ